MSIVLPEISVVIPVYNAGSFLEEAIMSVSQFDVVKQIIVVDDGSTDHSLGIALRLAKEVPRLEVLTHQGNENRGAGPTRNKGILHARYPWVAFLDADDWWLASRFDKTFLALQQYPDADGVYECLGIHFDSAEAEQIWRARHSFSYTTLKKEIAPELLIKHMAPFGKDGWFSGDAFLVKKDLLISCGLYSGLRMSQDTELFMKLALKGKLVAGNILEPVAVRRVHGNNRITAQPLTFYQYRLQLWEQFLDWGKFEGIGPHLLQRTKKEWLRCLFVCARHSGANLSHHRTWIHSALNLCRKMFY